MDKPQYYNEYKLYASIEESYEDFVIRYKQILADREINELEQGMEEYYER